MNKETICALAYCQRNGCYQGDSGFGDDSFLIVNKVFEGKKTWKRQLPILYIMAL